VDALRSVLRPLRNRRVALVAAAAVAVVALVPAVAALTDGDGTVVVAGAPDATTTTIALVSTASTTVATTTASTAAGGETPVDDTTAATEPTEGFPCTPERTTIDHWEWSSFVTNHDGTVTLTIWTVFGPARETWTLTFDDGDTYIARAEKTYRPDDFGTHWVDFSNDVSSCVARWTFTVEATARTTTSTLAEPSTTVDGS
jgi:hypothetical protein